MSSTFLYIFVRCSTAYAFYPALVQLLGGHALNFQMQAKL